MSIKYNKRMCQIYRMSIMWVIIHYRLSKTMRRCHYRWRKWHKVQHCAYVFDVEMAVMHYSYVIMGTIASQITSLTIVYSTVYSGAGQRKYQSSASLAFVRGIHRGPVNSPHKWSVTRKMFPFDDFIMIFLTSFSRRCIFLGLFTP